MNDRLAEHIRLLARLGATGSLAVFAASLSLSAQTAPAEEEEPQEERVVVTGSRISRIDVEGPQPVRTFTREEILASGYSDFGDFIQSLPANSGGVNLLTEAASFTRGAQTGNIRGLGSNRFLVLVNGRRTAGYALSDSFQRTAFDFGSIPSGAIDRVEFLKDGASAIYGSDAITGVFNIILRKDYTGAEMSVEYGNTFDHDMASKRVTGVFGAAAGKTSVLGTFSWSESNASYIKDYERSQSVNYEGIIDFRGWDNRSTFMFPANISFNAADAATAGLTGGAGFYTVSAPTATPTVGSFVPIFRTVLDPFALFEFANVYQLYPEVENKNFSFIATHEITDTLSMFAEFTYGNRFVDFDFTPAVVSSTGNPGTSVNGTLRISAANPYNPFGIDINSFRYRTSFLPNRGFQIDSENNSFITGLKGEIGYNWRWEAYAQYSSNSISEVATNAIRASDLQEALDGTTFATALNPFGPTQNQDVIDGLLTNSQNVSKSSVYNYAIGVDGTLFDLPSGPLGIAGGLELRRERLMDSPDSAAYVGSGGGAAFDGKREVIGGFVELSIPIIPSIQAQVALRHEDYVDDFGTATKPKFAASWRPLDWLLFRASFSKSFKAPDLALLYAPSQTSFTSGLVQDPLRVGIDPPQQQQTINQGNPNLQPEEADVIYAGVVIEPPFLKGLNLSADYFIFDVENVIVSPGATTILNNPGLYPDLQFVVRDNSGGYPGPIRNILTGPTNIAKQKYVGWDFAVSYRHVTDNLGTFNFRVDLTYIHNIELESAVAATGSFRNAGLYPNARVRSNTSVSWTKGDWAARVFMQHTGRFFNDGYDGIQGPTVDTTWPEKAHITFNPSITYKGFWGTDITVGVNNVFDNTPPFNGYELEGYDTFLYSGVGRYGYVRLTKEF